MLPASKPYKQYHSAQQRFLKPLMADFFRQELPKLFGPKLRDQLAEEIVQLIATVMPEKEQVKPGQLVWTAVDKTTRPDAPNRRFVPVVLTVIDETDMEKLAQGTPMRAIAEEAVARITREAYQQGGLLSMRDIGLFSWRVGTEISKKRKAYEQRHGTILPHTGSLQDMGTCLTHKATIVRKVIVEKKDQLQVASETNHSVKAVENYLHDFRRVQTCHRHNSDIEFIVQATGLTKHVVQQYLEILTQLENSS